MIIPDIKENWSGRVNTVTIGATEAEGGTRGRTVTIGTHPDRTDQHVQKLIQKILRAEAKVSVGKQEKPQRAQRTRKKGK